MLARIKFTNSHMNRFKENELAELESFLGEKLEVSKLKISEDGIPKTLDWRDTFDEEKIKKDSDYRLVTPSDTVQISDSNSFIVNLERFTSKYPALEFTVRGIPKSIDSNYNDMLNMMNEVSNKIEEATKRFNKVVEFNQKCEVHVPNLGLLNINKLAFATDICTESLQNILHQGWRIIAVCPQPDQRRPDYILGMHVNDIDKTVEVEHFNGNGREEKLD